MYTNEDNSMTAPLISVIVPVYKVEAYIDRCVESIVKQTYKDLEIILVDDGSPDNCPQICDEWARIDSRIKVIHSDNMGGGAARNIGLDYANGQFISFVDSDDYISPYMIEHLYYLILQGADVAECGYSEVYDDFFDFHEEQFKVRTYSVQEAMSEHIKDRIFRQIIWNKLYYRDIIGDIRFPIGCKIDDEFFTYKVLSNATKLVWSNKVCYAYRQNPNSVMHKAFDFSRLQAVDAKEQRLEFLKTVFPDLVIQANIDLLYTCLYLGQMSLKYLTDSERLDTFEKLTYAIRKYPLNISDMRCKDKVWLLLSKLSLQFTCRLRNFLDIGF